jgi:antitoxin (DNA-binding transcriptional repressor) of toxin-antitoxin stability system
MKVVPLSEAKAKLSRYGQLCHNEPIVVTVNGRPSFQLVPLDEDDDLIDRLIEHHPGFRKVLQRRLRERSASIETASRRLTAASSASNSRREAALPLVILRRACAAEESRSLACHHRFATATPRCDGHFLLVIPSEASESRDLRGAIRCGDDEPIVVTVNGRPSFQLVPLDADDDLIDRLIEHHPGFRKVLQRRLRERSVSVETASRRLTAASSRK